MKYTLFLFLLVLHFQSARSQINWMNVFHGQKLNLSEEHDAVLFNDSLYARCGLVSLHSCAYSVLQVFDTNGSLRWTKNYGYDALFNTDNWLCTAGVELGADDVYGDERMYFRVFSDDGRTLCETSFRRDIDWDVFPYPQPVSVCSVDSIIYWFYEHQTFKTGLFSNHLEVNSNTHKFSCASRYGDTLFAIASGNKLLFTDLEFRLVDSLEFQDTIIGLAEQQDELLLLFNNQLMKMENPDDTAETVLNTNNQFRKIVKNAYQDLIVTDQKDNLVGVWKLHDTIWIKLNEHLSPAMVKNVDYQNGKLYISGTSHMNEMVSYSIDTAYQETNDLPDVAITNVRNYHYTQSGYHKYWNFDCTLRNVGTDTINNVSTFALIGSGFQCMENFYQSEYNDLHLAPGDTITITSQISMFFADLIPKELCLRALLTNGVAERFTEDNIFCEKVNFISVPEFDISPVILYPNPANDVVQWDWIYENTEFTICDISGRVVQIGNCTKGENRIDLSDFNRGVYVITFSGYGKGCRLIIQ